MQIGGRHNVDTDLKSQKIENLWKRFLYRTETLYSCYTHHKVPWHVLHSKGKIGVLILQEVLFALVVHSVGVSEYGHYKAQARESPLDSGATNKAFFILGKQRSGKEYVAKVTS